MQQTSLIKTTPQSLQKIGAALAITEKLLHDDNPLGLPDLIPYRKGDKWGFCNRKKEIVIDSVYDFIRDKISITSYFKHPNGEFYEIFYNPYENYIPFRIKSKSIVLGKYLVQREGEWFTVLFDGQVIKGDYIQSGFGYLNHDCIIVLLKTNSSVAFFTLDGKEIFPFNHYPYFENSDNSIHIGEFQPIIYHLTKTKLLAIDMMYVNISKNCWKDDKFDPNIYIDQFGNLIDDNKRHEIYELLEQKRVQNDLIILETFGDYNLLMSKADYDKNKITETNYDRNNELIVGNKNGSVLSQDKFLQVINIKRFRFKSTFNVGNFYKENYQTILGRIFRFDRTQPLFDEYGYALVSKKTDNGKFRYGILEKSTLMLVIPCEYEDIILPWTNEIFLIAKGTLDGYSHSFSYQILNKNNTLVSNLWFSSLYKFSEELFLFFSGTSGTIDMNGNIKYLSNEYRNEWSWVEEFTNRGLFLAKKNSGKRMVSKQLGTLLKTIKEMPDKYYGPECYETIEVLEDYYSLGVLNSNLEEPFDGLFEKDFSNISILNNNHYKLMGSVFEATERDSFEKIFFTKDGIIEGLAKNGIEILKNNEYTYICQFEGKPYKSVYDLDFNHLFDKVFTRLLPAFSTDDFYIVNEMLFIVENNSKFGVIDRFGNTKIPIIYDIINPFRFGLSFVKKDNLSFVIDLNGVEYIHTINENSNYN